MKIHLYITDRLFNLLPFSFFIGKNKPTKSRKFLEISVIIVCIIILKKKCDRVCIKGPFVGNLKNEIIKFYDKLGFISFNFRKKSLVFAILKSIFPAEYRDVKITNIGEMAA